MNVLARLALFAVAIMGAFGIGAALGTALPDLGPSQHVEQHAEHQEMP